MYGELYGVALERQADALRQAEHERLIRTVTARQTTANGLYSAGMLIKLRKFLTGGGRSLPVQACAPGITPRCA